MALFYLIILLVRWCYFGPQIYSGLALDETSAQYNHISLFLYRVDVDEFTSTTHLSKYTYSVLNHTEPLLFLR